MMEKGSGYTNYKIIVNRKVAETFGKAFLEAAISGAGMFILNDGITLEESEKQRDENK